MTPLRIGEYPDESKLLSYDCNGNKPNTNKRALSFSFGQYEAADQALFGFVINQFRVKGTKRTGSKFFVRTSEPDLVTNTKCCTLYGDPTGMIILPPSFN